MRWRSRKSQCMVFSTVWARLLMRQQSWIRGKLKDTERKLARQVFGITVCLSAAGVLTPIFRAIAWKDVLPLAFLSVVLVVAARFGSAAGILGTAGAAIIFAEFLFDPVLSLRIGDSVQRNHLVWMVIIGIVVSEVVGVIPKTPPDRDDPKEMSRLRYWVLLHRLDRGPGRPDENEPVNQSD